MSSSQGTGEILMYDCTDDVMEHKRKVEYWMGDIASQITGRAKVHDDSKLKEPGKTIFDQWTPNLKQVEFGSEEYHEALKAMGQGLTHHYHSNRHHPEHFQDGIEGMTLVDLIEMLCDWLAAAEEKKVHIDLGYLQQRFGLSDQLVRIFRNTLEDIDFQSRAHNAPVPQFTPP